MLYEWLNMQTWAILNCLTWLFLKPVLCRIKTASQPLNRLILLRCDFFPVQVLVAGNDVSSNAEQAYGHLGFCPQINALWDDITVEEHLRCYAQIKGVPPSSVKNHVNR